MTTNLGGHEREIAPLVTLSTSKEGKKVKIGQERAKKRKWLKKNAQKVF